ncbi:prolyl oligopeptidase family serine peptidase [Flavobacterium macrobrachii]|uniref:prolyl oligopeptidase n=1 Tax=Flavobacterium macrobrachii TaxID=591204 RepID=A0ABS2CV09_9FLAO|nr:prolyl oligopeptidase family serine peptidase [Flavobacterium macrobrachii]MBM6498808.1 S9 family peptidase [Flavobacterium macrobrachii]
MKNVIFILSLLFCETIFCQQNHEKSKSEKYTKHGITITDEYSWLENLNSEETKTWVKNNNTITEEILEKAKRKYNTESKIIEYNKSINNRIPSKKGKYYYSTFYFEGKTLPIIFYRKDVKEKPTKLFDLNEAYTNKNMLFNSLSPSGNSEYLAYKISHDGSDLGEINFFDINKRKLLPDVIKGVKFSNIGWNLNHGIFYNKNNNINKTAIDSTNQLYYHKIGTPQSEDQLVFDASKTGNTFKYYSTRGKLIVIETNKEETLSNYYEASLSDNEFYLYKFLDNQSTDMKFLNYRNDSIYYSSKQFEWGEVRAFNIKNRNQERVVIPQIYSQLLTSTHFTNDYIFCNYKTLNKSYIRVYDANGKFIRKFDSSENFDISFNFYDNETKDLYVTLHSYTTSFKNYRLNVATGEINEFQTEHIKIKASLFPSEYFETKTITFKSRDNKDVPITIIHKKGLKFDGNNPTLLTAYGGYGTVSRAYFSSGMIHFIEKGGVFAYAQIRGGGEKGLKWHQDGKGLKKMNSFNDFIDAAEFLIKEKYTSPKKLGITGGSNGGLVVGVAMTKRPDLFKVVIPKMGAFDMLKFDQFTVGRYHLNEYGNPENKEEFNSLLAYSPYHNIDENTNYPTTLIITSDNDDRVPPLHSYKFAAKLQNRTEQKNPIYLISLSDAGHYGKTASYEDDVKSDADFYNFLLYHLNE